MAEPGISVERLTEYSDEVATDLGQLMPHLSERLTDTPLSEEVLRKIIESPYHDQLVARMNGRIVGSATLSLIMSPELPKPLAWLGAFVTHPDARGRGVGDVMWQELLVWCEEHEANLGFTSHPSRELAHRFYKAHGARIRETTVFHLDVDSGGGRE